jgi:hypothetical protein
MHPQGQADWEDDLILTQALRSLPNAPVPSNFTAQVMQAVTREQRELQRAESTVVPRMYWWHRFSKRLAWTALLLLAGSTTVFFYHQNNSQKKFARNVAEVSNLASLPGAEVLQDFDAIDQLRYASAASDEALIEFLR